MTAVFSPPAQADPLGATLTSVIRAASDNAPRNRQVSIGPSEMGDECTRRLAYKSMGTTETNTSSDPLPSIIGTATHAWLAAAFLADNANYPIPRWLVEQKVHPDDAHPGSCDLYDTWTGGVIDWKVVGAAALKRHKLSGPSQRYVVQGHLYGLGFRRLGLWVNTVSLALLPRAGMLTGLTTWTTGYDESIALAALSRLGDIACLTYDLDLENHPERWAMVPAAPSSSCNYCPMFKAGSPVDGAGCPGELAA
jgi:hypothetical protein